MKQKLVYILILPIFAFAIHKFHLSLTKIDFNEEEKSIQITMRCFINDIEKAINEKEQVTLELDTKVTHKNADNYIKKYILDNFKIKVNNKETPLNYLGKEYERDIVYFYLEVDSINKITSFQVTNKVLLKTFNDQQNIIKLNINNKKETFLFKENDYTKSITY